MFIALDMYLHQNKPLSFAQIDAKQCFAVQVLKRHHIIVAKWTPPTKFMNEQHEPESSCRSR